VTSPRSFGRLQNPNNTSGNLRKAQGRAGLSSRAAVNELGHANASMTTDVYFGRKVATGAAAVLEALST
jgi:hypothetical protein